MIDAGPSLQAAAGLPATAVARYLRSTGWKAERSRLAGVTIHVKALPDAAEPIRIVLPETANFDDERRRVADALRTLEALEERPIETIVDEVRQIATQTNGTAIRGTVRSGKYNGPAAPDRNPGSHSIDDVEGLNPDFAIAFRRVGIGTTEKLLAAAKSLRSRKLLAEKTAIDEKVLLRVANMVDRMRIEGVGRKYAELLEAAGVVTVKELRYRNPTKLAQALAAANVKTRLVRLPPSEQEVTRWIDAAKKIVR